MLLGCQEDQPRLRNVCDNEADKLKVSKNDDEEKEEGGKKDPDMEIKKEIEQDQKENPVINNKLLCVKDMPPHLQFNPHILEGYRPLQSPLGCIRSAFQWHNESVNIITHAIPIFYIIFTVPDVLPWHSKELTFLAWCHIAGILCPWLGSFAYHMFMNLNYGPTAYYILLQIDMLGIWTSQSIGALPLLFATTKCLPSVVRWCVILFYCFLSLWGLYKFTMDFVESECIVTVML
ncbi:hypothetical protein ABEB36_005846 [Hypothenemus hampei]|uniref:Progestin and adipoQ receptor family member 4 n=1 Tax=Hypothenemus hampei TaxID=57062 RepID=A0ABD1EZM2_HYPHA